MARVVDQRSPYERVQNRAYPFKCGTVVPAPRGFREDGRVWVNYDNAPLEDAVAEPAYVLADEGRAGY